MEVSFILSNTPQPIKLQYRATSIERQAVVDLGRVSTHKYDVYEIDMKINE